MKKFSKFTGEISTIGIIANPKVVESDYEIIKDAIEYLKNKNFKVIIEEEIAEKFKLKNFEVKNIKEIYADLVLTLGGDGTILHSLRELPNNPLILGINFGKLGFLTTLNKKNLFKGIEKIVDKNFYVEERTMLLVNKKYNALNELVVSGQFPANLLDFVLTMNKDIKFKLRADGMIVATQTGSTAYSLSLGGPIVHQNADVFVISPINPFLHRSKSIVVNDKTKISISVVSGKVNVYLIVDGKMVETVKLGDKIFVEKSKKKARFVQFKKEWKNIEKII